MNTIPCNRPRSLWNDEYKALCERAGKLRELLNVALLMHEGAKKHNLPFRMVIGPMTTGGYGFEKNMFIFERAVDLLENRGLQDNFIVFNQLGFQDAMVRILNLDRSKADELGKTVPYPHDILNEFYAPLFEAVKFNAINALPKTHESTGGSKELGYCGTHSIPVFPYPKKLYNQIISEMRGKFPR